MCGMQLFENTKGVATTVAMCIAFLSMCIYFGVRVSTRLQAESVWQGQQVLLELRGGAGGGGGGFLDALLPI